MQLTARLSAYAAFVFAAVCLWFAFDAFSTLPGADPDQVSGGPSFAWFWAFLGVVGAVIGWASLKAANSQRDNDA
jgi:hypothetical protein